MDVQRFITDLGYEVITHFEYNDTVLSDVFTSDDSLIIVDKMSIFNTEFPYKLYCQKQNEWMKKFTKVYRFVEDDVSMAKLYLLEDDRDYSDKKTIDRELLVVDPSPLESTFETCFEEAYGSKSFNFLFREYSFQLKNGSTGYIDYALFNKDESWIAIEENGISYHHPFLIKEDKYKIILNKQNSVVSTNGIVYRWDTASIRNTEKIIDEIYEFIGDLSDYLFQYDFKENRDFCLYEHQEEYISNLKYSNKNEAALVVLPTGTGKTLIATETLKYFYTNSDDNMTLVLVPSIALRNQWKKILIKTFGVNYYIKVMTYNKASRNYHYDNQDLYKYIILDEAHHAVAPILRKVIQHYTPKFLLGLTATDKRLDEKKLENVFGSYNSNLTLEKAIKKNILAPIRSFRLETNIDLTKIKFNGKDYNSSQLEKQIRVPSRNHLIVDIIDEFFHKKLSDKFGIIFCINIAHAKEMANLLKEKGISAESIDGKDKKREEKIKDYMEFKVQFLCTCSLLTEGWDAPHTSIIVMARPTLSKVLYTQQLGRGTRRFPGKEALYVIDVVDTYGTFGTISNRPWSLHALFNQLEYRRFGNIVKTGASTDELLILDTFHETSIKLQPFDIFTLERLYGDYLSEEQLARKLFISTSTIKNWIRKNSITPDIRLPLSRGFVYLFKPEQINIIRLAKGLKEHSEETITDDFWDFIDIGNYTFSYKIYFILSILDIVDSTGDCDVNNLSIVYQNYYINRNKNNLVIDRKKSPYNNIEFLNNNKNIKKSMLTNPFEKFERKRFMYYNKDLAKISIHHKLWDELKENDGLNKLKDKMYADLDKYYEEIKV